MHATDYFCILLSLALVAFGAGVFLSWLEAPTAFWLALLVGLTNGLLTARYFRRRRMAERA
ncbi:MAG: hypothetical protein WD294_04705 [Phycisphaeraceae bacterium]